MMKNSILSVLLIGFATICFAQETEEPLTRELNVEAYLDMYYVYNFNRPDSRVNETRVNDFRHNSISVNMFRTNMNYRLGDLELIGDFGFGPGTSGANYGNAGIGNSIAINRAFLRYTLNERLVFTAGQYRSHIGVEGFSPFDNISYSLSYQFNYGPFYHTGIKFEYLINEKWKVMAGLVNGWDEIIDLNEKKAITLQVSTTAIENLDLTLSWIGGDEYNSVSSFGSQKGSYTSLFDIVAKVRVSETLMLMTNSSFGMFSASGTTGPPGPFDSDGSWWAVGLYAYYSPSDIITFGFRNEYFKDEDNLRPSPGSLTSLTFVVDYRFSEYFLIRPELKIDVSENEIFEGLNGSTNTTQPTLGVAILACIK